MSSNNSFTFLLHEYSVQQCVQKKHTLKVCNNNLYKYNYLTKKETTTVIVYSLFKSLSIAALISPFDSISATREKHKLSRGYKNTYNKCIYNIIE